MESFKSILKSEKTISIMKFLLIVLVIYLALRTVLIPLITSAGFVDFTARLGFWGYLVVIAYFVISEIFAPLAGTPGLLLGIALYGFEVATLLMYIGAMLSAALNFYIARRFGRSWVARLVGKKYIHEVDEFTQISGEKVLWVGRIFGSALFEVVSYAVGLTNMPFRKYMTITMIGAAVPTLVYYYIFKDVDFASEEGITIWFASLMAGGLLFTYFLNRYIRKVRKSKLAKLG